MSELLTPDFYSYRWAAIGAVSLDGDFAVLDWPDGVRLRAHGWWLRENVVAEGAIDPVTREGTLDLADHDIDLHITLAAVSTDGGLSMRWSDGFSGHLHPGWLRHVAEQRHGTHALFPSAEPWTAATMPEPPTIPGPRVLADDGALRDWLIHLVRFGIGRLRGLPADDSTVLAVARRIGVPRETNFGLDWPVKAEILSNDENSTANTTLRLGPHTDLPTREVPPGFQFLHCIVNTAAGGHSRMTDGAAVVAHLEAHEPDVLDALTTLRWVFFNRSRDHDHRWSGPVVELATATTPLTIRAFYPLRAFPDMAEHDISRAYMAARRFQELTADPAFQIGYPFEPGDLVGFDNRRVLHGRDAFDTAAGRRYLRGCYVDHDEVHSRLRVLQRRTDATETDRSGR